MKTISSSLRFCIAVTFIALSLPKGECFTSTGKVGKPNPTTSQVAFPTSPLILSDTTTQDDFEPKKTNESCNEKSHSVCRNLVRALSPLKNKIAIVVGAFSLAFAGLGSLPAYAANTSHLLYETRSYMAFTPYARKMATSFGPSLAANVNILTTITAPLAAVTGAGALLSRTRLTAKKNSDEDVIVAEIETEEEATASAIGDAMEEDAKETPSRKGIVKRIARKLLRKKSREEREEEMLQKIRDPEVEVVETSNPLEDRKYRMAREVQPKSSSDEAKLADKYANIEDVGDRAYQILVDLGMVEEHQDPRRRLK